jgi:hypothetical protein
MTAKLGEGGMGQVWRATDTRLSGEVAIKVIPESFAAVPDLITRFTCEAQVLASLNHPNIAAIYAIEDRAIVMELVLEAGWRGWGNRTVKFPGSPSGNRWIAGCKSRPFKAWWNGLAMTGRRVKRRSDSKRGTPLRLQNLTPLCADRTTSGAAKCYSTNGEGEQHGSGRLRNRPD